MMRWVLALIGLFLTVFAVVALSGPGRIDIVDGQTRYEVARSLVEHGDSVIRDPNVWFNVFPGRNGQLYTRYRFPQSAAGVVAILAADATGLVSEARRHFFFVLTGGVACAGLAVIYAAFFRSQGHEPRVALLWAAAGVFCTPSWFYGTSTFDDILGATAVVLAVAVAFASRHRHPLAGAAVAGFALGLAFNCKEPLGIFVLAVLAAIRDPDLDWRRQWRRMAIIVALLVVFVVIYQGYDRYKFPPGSTAGHAELLKKYAPTWSGNPITALLALAFSFGTGVLYYSPSLVIVYCGIRRSYRSEKLACRSILAATGVFVFFISLLTCFKGDPAWGPRYLTPIFAVLWIWAPAGARVLRRGVVQALLVAGFVVQLGALSIEHHRLYIERSLPSAFFGSNPGLYFHPSLSHLINRPREIVEVYLALGERAEFFSPSPSPTFAFPVINFVAKGRAAIKTYHVLNSFRPWWASMHYLAANMRPVQIARTAILLAVMALTGLVMIVVGASGRPSRDLCRQTGRGVGLSPFDQKQRIGF